MFEEGICSSSLFQINSRTFPSLLGGTGSGAFAKVRSDSRVQPIWPLRHRARGGPDRVISGPYAIAARPHEGLRSPYKTGPSGPSTIE